MMNYLPEAFSRVTHNKERERERERVCVCVCVCMYFVSGSVFFGMEFYQDQMMCYEI